MNITRRSFLGFLGTAPLAATAATQLPITNTNSLWNRIFGFKSNLNEHLRSLIYRLRREEMIRSLIGVQPMKAPEGLVFILRRDYALHN